MKRFKNIMLLDPGPKGRIAALDRAITLARANSARLTVAGPVDEVPDDLAEIVMRRRTLDLRRELREEERELLEDWVGALPEGGPPLSIEVLPGNSVVEVLRRVDSGGHDLLMLAAKGRVGGWFGSMATHLLRKSAVPVWVLKPRPVPRYRRILAAVDRDTIEWGREALNLKILELAASLAHADKSQLHLIHAYSLVGEVMLRNRLGMTEVEIREIACEAERARREWLDWVLASVPTARDTAHRHLIRGSAQESIASFVKTREIDLIVMGTLGRSGVAGAVIGNTAERILNRVQCAVLAVKPDGFRSPIPSPKG